MWHDKYSSLSYLAKMNKWFLDSAKDDCEHPLLTMTVFVKFPLNAYKTLAISNIDIPNFVHMTAQPSKLEQIFLPFNIGNL